MSVNGCAHGYYKTSAAASFEDLLVVGVLQPLIECRSECENHIMGGGRNQLWRMRGIVCFFVCVF